MRVWVQVHVPGIARQISLTEMNDGDYLNKKDDFWPTDGSSVQSSSDDLNGHEYVLMGLRDEATDSEGSEGSNKEPGLINQGELGSDSEGSLADDQGTVIDEVGSKGLDESSACSEKLMNRIEERGTKGKEISDSGRDHELAGGDQTTIVSRKEKSLSNCIAIPDAVGFGHGFHLGV